MTTGSTIEDHHIYPRAYIQSVKQLDVDKSEAEQLLDTVVNRTLIPKTTNLQVGKKSPHKYFLERQKDYPDLRKSLESHLIPVEILDDPDWDTQFRKFLDYRANQIFTLMKKHTIDLLPTMQQSYEAPSEIELPKGVNLKLPNMG